MINLTVYPIAHPISRTYGTALCGDEAEVQATNSQRRFSLRCGREYAGRESHDDDADGAGTLNGRGGGVDHRRAQREGPRLRTQPLGASSTCTQRNPVNNRRLVFATTVHVVLQSVTRHRHCAIVALQQPLAHRTHISPSPIVNSVVTPSSFARKLSPYCFLPKRATPGIYV